MFLAENAENRKMFLAENAENRKMLLVIGCFVPCLLSLVFMILCLIIRR